jgi:alpha-beta hydrolase superfamily lysophospholipase
MPVRRSRPQVFRFLGVYGLLIAAQLGATPRGTDGFGAGRFAAAQAPAAPAPAAPGSASAKVADPEIVSMRTKDGVNLIATYMASNKGKDAVAVILLHMFKGNRHDVEALGKFLQSKGHAVIMPDLRGHGDSTSVEGFNRKLDAATMPATQFPLMVTHDLEAVKKFLVEQNNASRLNIERLCVVGAEMSVPIAVNWSVMDWAWPVLPNLKQGQDVKALVLLSPVLTYKTVNCAQAFTNSQSPVRDKISLFLVAGAEDVASAKEAGRLHDQLERFRPKPEKVEDKTVFLENTLKTKLVGTKLLGEATLGVEQYIAQFIELRLATQPWPWKDRTRAN